jgi:hypothetical protein
LVVDTVGFKVGPLSMIDRYGTPYSDSMHLTERFRIITSSAAREAIAHHEKEYGRVGGPQGAMTLDANSDKGLQVARSMIPRCSRPLGLPQLRTCTQLPNGLNTFALRMSTTIFLEPLSRSLWPRNQTFDLRGTGAHATDRYSQAQCRGFDGCLVLEGP